MPFFKLKAEQHMNSGVLREDVLVHDNSSFTRVVDAYATVQLQYHALLMGPVADLHACDKNKPAVESNLRMDSNPLSFHYNSRRHDVCQLMCSVEYLHMCQPL